VCLNGTLCQRRIVEPERQAQGALHRVCQFDTPVVTQVDRAQGEVRIECSPSETMVAAPFPDDVAVACPVDGIPSLIRSPLVVSNSVSGEFAVVWLPDGATILVGPRCARCKPLAAKERLAASPGLEPK
jgi:hypothetical protein